MINVRRELVDHKVNDLNEAIKIEVLDAPGQGGASHVYSVSLPSEQPSNEGEKPLTHTAIIRFQKGPIKEAGVNGLSQEALMAIVIDRLRCFQAGEYACRDNAMALTHLETSLLWLQKRTHERMRRGVEGTHQK